jgi:hypothetical protein
MRSLLVLALGFLALEAGSSEVYRCSTASGVEYQALPCDAGASERAVRIQEFPPANTAERDRLLQREAALDARLLKRAEIDAAERMAREARWAQEAQLAAERERAQAPESGYYYPVYPVYYGRPFRARPVSRPGMQPQPLRY